MDENMEAVSQDNEINSAWDDSESEVQQQSEATVGQEAEKPSAPDQQEGVQAAEQEKADQPELFTLKNRDEVRQVTKDDLIAMAQKGWDYDTVRTERDQLRQYRDEANPALELVKDYAKRNNMSVSDYLDFCRKQDLMRSGLSAQAADEKLVLEKERAELDARQAKIKAEEDKRNSQQQKAHELEEARKKDIANFCKMYPSVDPKSIPQDVWTAVKGGDTLTNAYTMYENKRLSAELAAERQNKENQKRTPGSLGGNSATEAEEIDRLWAEDD